MFGTHLYQGLEPLFLREGVGNYESGREASGPAGNRCTALVSEDRPLETERPPCQALGEGIPGSFLEPLARSWSHWIPKK
jgi:hypothetical protein